MKTLAAQGIWRKKYFFPQNGDFSHNLGARICEKTARIDLTDQRADMAEDIDSIVSDNSVSLSGLLKFSKNALASAIIELKARSMSEAITLRQIDLEMKRLEVESERMRMQIGESLTHKLVDYGHSVKDHKYGPKSIGHISEAVIASVSAQSVAATPPSSSSSELEIRIERARAQGMRWNSSDKRPDRQSTVIKKLEFWEAGYAASVSADLDFWAKSDYSEAIKQSESFVVGLCERMENKLGISVSSKYLKIRFTRDAESYGKTIIRSPLPFQSSDKGYITKTLIADWLGSDFEQRATKQTYDWAVKRIGSYYDTHNPDFKSMGIQILKSLTSPQTIPTAIVFDLGRPHNIIQDVKRNGLYDQRYEEFWQSFCSKLGWV